MYNPELAQRSNACRSINLNTQAYSKINQHSKFRNSKKLPQKALVPEKETLEYFKKQNLKRLKSNTV